MRITITVPTPTPNQFRSYALDHGWKVFEDEDPVYWGYLDYEGYEWGLNVPLYGQPITPVWDIIAQSNLKHLVTVEKRSEQDIYDEIMSYEEKT